MSTFKSLKNSSRFWKIALMKPSDKAGNVVGTARMGNRKGGKIRGMKSGRQRQAKVNVAKLVQKTNKAATGR